MHPDGRYSHVVVETEPEVLSNEQIAASFHPGIRVPWVFLIALLTSVTSVVGTYLTTHSAPTDCASRSDLQTVRADVAEINKTMTALLVTVNANADREANHFAITTGLLGARSK